jgi:hypothetical protein
MLLISNSHARLKLVVLILWCSAVQTREREREREAKALYTSRSSGNKIEHGCIKLCSVVQRRAGGHTRWKKSSKRLLVACMPTLCCSSGRVMMHRKTLLPTLPCTRPCLMLPSHQDREGGSRLAEAPHPSETLLTAMASSDQCW